MVYYFHTLNYKDKTKFIHKICDIHVKIDDLLY